MGRNTTHLRESQHIHTRTEMPTWNAPTLTVIVLIAFYVYHGVRGALGEDSAVPDAVKPAKLMYVQALGFHILMDACLMVGVVVNDIAHEMMPAFLAAMLVVVSSQYMMDDLAGAAPAGTFALVFTFLVPGAPGRQPIKWNLATFFYSLQGLLLFVVGIAMIFGDDSVIPKQMKPLDSMKQLKLLGTTELTLSAYILGSILTGHAQAMQPFCGLFILVAVALHAVIGDIEGCPLIVGLAMAHICFGLFWKGKDEAKKQ